MPRGGAVGRGKPRHKGRGKHYTTGADQEAEAEKIRKEKEWKLKKGIEDDEDEEEEEEEAGVKGKKTTAAAVESSEEEESESEEEKGDDTKAVAEADAAREARRQPRAAAASAGGASRGLPPTGDSDEDSDEDEARAKGVERLIEVQNPNRVVKKMKKASEVSADDKVQLSRREREELEKQKAKARYEKLHQAGKTDEARADLARLALVRKQREDAKKRKLEDDKKKVEGGAKKR